MSKLTVIDPAGYHILVRVEGEEKKDSDSLIILPDDIMERDRLSRDIGQVVAMGPVAYKGYKGAIDLNGAADWGVELGDNVEFRKYDGKVPAKEGFENYRELNDEDIIAVMREVETELSIDEYYTNKIEESKNNRGDNV